MEHFTRYFDEAQRRFANIGACPLSELRKIFDRIPNCRVDDADFTAAMEKARAVPFKDRLFQSDSMLDRDAIYRIAAELDKQVRQRFEVAADRQAAERMKSYDLLDNKLKRQAQFEQAKYNEAALIAAGIMKGADDERN